MQSFELSDQHDDQECEDDETMALVLQRPSPIIQTKQLRSYRRIVGCAVALCCLLWSAWLVCRRWHWTVPVQETSEFRRYGEPSPLTNLVAAEVSCPTLEPPLQNVESYQPRTAWWNDLNLDVTEYLNSFRDLEFDNWGHSYQEVKRSLLHWKRKRYKSLRNHSSIYESGCGMGMNLYMTLEILQEQHHLHSVKVFGSDAVPDLIHMAQTITQQLPAGGTLESICAADATKLSHIPDDIFDLVFSGSIPPLWNPLNIPGTMDEILDAYSGDCHSHPTRAQEAQVLQEEWYRAWVTEMVRIAKPGAPIIVEFVGWPLCAAGGAMDGGGVGREFWDSITGIKKSSLVLEDDTLTGKHYHVYVPKHDSSH